MASSLNHPHILTVYDAGEFEGRQYLVTEFVDGGTLKDWASAEKRTWRQIVELLVGVADGLAAAHAAGILHRDIKPANILVAKNGYAKLADFGLAKLDGADHPGGRSRERSTEGPPARHGHRDHRLHVAGAGFGPAAGCAQRHLFLRRGAVRNAGGTAAVRRRDAIWNFADASSMATPDRSARTFRCALRMVVEKALEKDPAERYQSMREMVVDLRRLTRQSGEAATRRCACSQPIPVQEKTRMERPARLRRSLASCCCSPAACCCCGSSGPPRSHRGR